MAGVETKPTLKRTPAVDRAFERVRQLAAAGDMHSYPDGTTFLPSDLPDFAEMLRSDLLEGGPIVVIYPDGRERFIRPIDPAQPRSPLARLFRRSPLR